MGPSLGVPVGSIKQLQLTLLLLNAPPNSLHCGKHPPALHRLLTTPATAFPQLSQSINTFPNIVSPC